ncbi:MAG: DNA-formamidopyrimidine glycosylase family protein [Planctomycetota bacterium]
MPELPDVTVYRERLVALLGGRELDGVRLFSPFVLRSVEPPVQALVGRTLQDVERLGKRLVLVFGDDLFLVLHLMIAGRLRLRKPGAKPPGKMGLAAFDFAASTLMLTEAASKKRASLHVVHGRAGLAEFDRGGLEVMDTDVEAFAAALRRENRTLKRALTDPRILSGIGNAYSDEILHAARLSPTQLTANLGDDAMARLFAATRDTLRTWTERLRTEVGDGFPDEVTAFREAMAVHGRYKQPCPVCQTPVQHILYASNECNYCPTCQTEGRLLADRGLSQLMRKDWPKTLEELEEKKGRPP